MTDDMAKDPRARATGADGPPASVVTEAEAAVLRLLASRQRLASALSAASQEREVAGMGDGDAGVGDPAASFCRGGRGRRSRCRRDRRKTLAQSA